MGGSWTSICLVPVACAMLCGAVNGRQLSKLPAPDSKLNIYALPIGQGDCTIIQCPANSGVQHYTGFNYNQLKRSRSNDRLGTLRSAKRQKSGPSSSSFSQSMTQSPPPTLLTVVDMGAVGRKYMSEENLSSFLGDQKRYIEVVTISHPDADHYNYIPSVLPISTLSALKGVYIGCTKNQYSGDEYGESTMRGWLSAAENSGKLIFGDGKKCTSSPNECPAIEICGGVATLRMLGANMGDTECCSQYRNSNSLVLRLEYGRFKLLLPGDFQDISKGSSGVQRDLINAWPNGGIQADFYKVAHHGAYQGGSSSTTKANKDHFLQAVSPKYAFSSSAAPPNSYSHPHCGLYYRLRDLGSIARGRSLRNPQTYYTCGRGRGVDETIRNNNYGIYSTSPRSDQPTIIHIATDGRTSSIRPIPYRST